MCACYQSYGSTRHCVLGAIFGFSAAGSLGAHLELSTEALAAMALTLKVQHLSKKRRLAIRDSDTIESVKLAIQDVFGFTPASLLLDGVHLVDGKTMADYHVDTASVISVTRQKACSCFRQRHVRPVCS